MSSESEIIKGIGSKTGSEKWAHIEDLIKRWKNRDPYNYEVNRQYNIDRRENLKDKEFGKLDNHGMADGRFALSVNPNLMAYIETFYPRFFEDKKNTREFGKRFPMFRIADKV